MYALGRMLQLAALAILPIAMMMELQQAIDQKQLLTLATFGATIFGIGYVLQGIGGKNRSSK